MVPSVAVPLRMMPTAFIWYTSASAIRNALIGWKPFSVLIRGSCNVSTPSTMLMFALGGITYTLSGSTIIPCSTLCTGMVVFFCRISGSMLSWSGLRCEMNT